MAAEHLELGKRGEEIACQFLEEELGCRILERNWRSGKAEIDIIAALGETIVFIEVKTRRKKGLYGPEGAVSAAKQRLIAQAAAEYLFDMQHQWAFRFDIMAILWNTEEQYTIQHFPDAFFPGFK